MPDISTLPALSAALTELLADASPAIVAVTSHRSRASGFVWKDGLVVTADETLADDGDISVAFAGGETASATIVGRDHTTDIALLKLDTKGAAAAKLTQAVPSLGSLAVVASTDHGAPAASLGMVSLSAGRWRSLRGGEIDARIELDVRLRRDGEGGLALGPDGAAFGMVVAGARRRVLVIPSATIARVAAAARDPRPYRPRLPRARAAAGPARQRRRRRDGDGRRQRRAWCCGGTAPGRRDRRLERRSIARRAGAGAGARTRQCRHHGRARTATRRRTGDGEVDDRRKARRVSETDSPLVIAIEIDDPALADRLTALLSEVNGLRLAAPGEAAALAVVSRSHRARSEPGEFELTPRERDVLALMAEGASNKQIARQLGISVHTAKFHVASVLEKLDATGRTDAVAHAARMGVIHL